MRHVPMRLRHLTTLLFLCACAREKRRYDVLLITLDTTRADHLGCYEGAFATPAVDAIAVSGVQFEQADTAAPLTLPAHVLAGRSSRVEGVPVRQLVRRGDDRLLVLH